MTTRGRAREHPPAPHDDGDRVVSDTGPFSIVPEWVLDADISDRALRLYCVLARFADYSSGRCFPARSRLADRLRCSLDSVDRAIKELVRAGAVEVTRRRDAKGDFDSNLYTVRRVMPGSRTRAATPGRTRAATRSRTTAGTGGRTGAAENETHPEREPWNDTHLSRERVEAVVEALGVALRRTPRTARERERWEHAAAELAAAEVSPGFVELAGRAWSWLGWDHQPSPAAIAGQWSALEEAVIDIIDLDAHRATQARQHVEAHAGAEVLGC